MKLIIPFLFLSLLSACGGAGDDTSDTAGSGSDSDGGTSSDAGDSSNSSSTNSQSSEQNSSQISLSSSSVNNSNAGSSINSSSTSSLASSAASSVVTSSSSVVSVSSSVISSTSSAVSSSSMASSQSSPSSSFSSSSESSSSSSNAPTAPVKVKAGAGNKQAKLDWQTVTNADSYHVFFASEPNIDPINIGAYNDGDWQQASAPPITISGLDNGKTYYFVVAAVESGNESAASTEVKATPSQPSAALSVSAAETLMLELVNRARFDPTAEAARFGIDINEGLNPGTLSGEQRPPLAFNELLKNAARSHSQWMLDNDIFSHTGENDSSMTDRIAAAGYSLTGGWTAGENISVTGSIPAPNLINAAISQHEGLFKSSGHRENILNASFREIGIGQRAGDFAFSSDIYPSSMITQNFARHGSGYFISGVVYRDTDNNGAYSAGEGLNNVTVSAGNASTITGSSGAYTIARPNGTYIVAAFGGSVDVVSATVTVSNANKKVNIKVNGSTSQLTQW